MLAITIIYLYQNFHHIFVTIIRFGIGYSYAYGESAIWPSQDYKPYFERFFCVYYLELYNKALTQPRNG